MNNISNINIRALKIFLLLYVAILVIFSFMIIPNNDSFYYWEWSKNLQISYYDGPPMIAYAIRIVTTLFGNNVFSVNLVGVLVALATVYVITEIINLLSEQKIGLLIGILWLTDPYNVNEHIIVAVTYDSLVNLFDLLTLLFALKYIKHHKLNYIYYIGVSAGLGLLSKYTSVILLLGLIIYFISNKELRPIFKTIHVYLAIIICFIIFSPVIIWNYQHDWASFLFQLKYHAWEVQTKVNVANNRNILGKYWHYVWNAVLGPMFIYYVIFIFLWIKHKVNIPETKHNYLHRSIYLILTIMSTIFLFWFILTPFAMVDLIYLITFNSLILIIVGYFLLQNKFYKLIVLLIMASSILSIIKMVNHSFVPGCPPCYKRYIKENRIPFYTPFKKYIKDSNI